MTSKMRSTIELQLLDFGVRYRKLGEDLYFCMLPNGITFDLLCGDNDTVQMWRFIDAAPSDKAGTRYICSKENASLGVEITDDGDMKLFTELQCVYQNPGFVQHIKKMMVGFFNMITQYESRKPTVG